MTSYNTSHKLFSLLLATVLIAGCVATATAKSRHGRSKSKARTAWVKKSGKKGKSRYSSSSRRRSTSSHRTRRQAAITAELPFSVSDRIYVSGTTSGGDYVVFELLGNEAQSVKKFSTASGTTASGSFMAGGEVFTTSNNSSKAYVLWNGKTINDLTSGETSNHANAIWLWDDEIYIAGVSGNCPTLWTNGKAVTLDDYTGAALDVCYANKQTYCCGYTVADGGQREARIWSSGGKVQVPAGMSVIAGIMVKGADVWVAGADHNGKPVAYKNAQQLALNVQAGDEANTIAVEGDNVYVAGTAVEQGEKKAILWVNGERQYLDALKLQNVKLMRDN